MVTSSESAERRPSNHSSSNPGLAIAAAALVGVQVGAAAVASRFVIAETDPIMLGLLRYAVGVLCLAPFVLVAPRPRFATRDLAPMAVLGITQFAILIILFNIALQNIPAGRVALVFASFPLQTMLLAAILGRERLTPARGAGVLITMAGVALALGEKAFAGPSNASWWGEAAAFGAALCGAVCSVLYRPYLQRYPALAVGAFAMLASVVFLAVAAGILGSLAPWPSLSWRGIAAVLFIGASSGIGYVALLWAYARTTPTRVTIFQALAPPTAAALGWGFLGEPVSTTFLAGIAVVIFGIALAHWPNFAASKNR